MAVETFFLFGFRAFSDVLKEIFPPGEGNLIVRIIEKLESKELDGDNFLKILEKAMIKYKDIAFEFSDLKFHLLKQLEPAFGNKIVLNLDPVQPIVVKINNNSNIFEVKWATPQELTEISGITIPFNIFKAFLIDDLDVLKLIVEDKIEIRQFNELNEIIVRALLGFTSAFFLRNDFQENVKNKLKSFVSSLIS